MEYLKKTFFQIDNESKILLGIYYGPSTDEFPYTNSFYPNNSSGFKIPVLWFQQS